MVFIKLIQPSLCMMKFFETGNKNEWENNIKTWSGVTYQIRYFLNNKEDLGWVLFNYEPFFYNLTSNSDYCKKFLYNLIQKGSSFFSDNPIPEFFFQVLHLSGLTLGLFRNLIGLEENLMYLIDISKNSRNLLFERITNQRKDMVIRQDLHIELQRILLNRLKDCKNENQLKILNDFKRQHDDFLNKNKIFDVEQNLKYFYANFENQKIDFSKQEINGNQMKSIDKMQNIYRSIDVIHEYITINPVSLKFFFVSLLVNNKTISRFWFESLQNETINHRFENIINNNDHFLILIDSTLGKENEFFNALNDGLLKSLSDTLTSIQEKQEVINCKEKIVEFQIKYISYLENNNNTDIKKQLLLNNYKNIELYNKKNMELNKNNNQQNIDLNFNQQQNIDLNFNQQQNIDLNFNQQQNIGLNNKHNKQKSIDLNNIDMDNEDIKQQIEDIKKRILLNNNQQNIELNNNQQNIELNNNQQQNIELNNNQQNIELNNNEQNIDLNNNNQQQNIELNNNQQQNIDLNINQQQQ